MKRILVILNDPLLAIGVENLLTRETDLTVQSAASCDGKALVHQVENFQPEVIIFDENHPIDQLPVMLNLLKDCPELRFMVVGVNDNRVHIYNKQEILITRGADLVEAIRQY